SVWSIGERKFGCNFKRRKMIFDSLIGSILMYGAEVWGWKEYEEVERVQEKYVRWVLGVDRHTPGYIVREECKVEKLKIETGKRAVRSEERTNDRLECRILLECLKEVRKDGGKDIWK